MNEMYYFSTLYGQIEFVGQAGANVGATINSAIGAACKKKQVHKNS
ncbi:hypothetical protein BN8_03031 [Fibrisoma limi BUZ 3]|uniref:Uncharacterized protein n=1 Tax=Fibrisoma limi BUZ 3 TaxID=1185876 RepID=I2GJ24_9BACT|nr:hypothetical protein BN8_03031 [Fibrisoma limi BUZ 3]